MMADSIFTKIIKGEIPCFKIYEDEFTFAFLDIYPIQPGHTLVVPKKQIDYVWNLDDDGYQQLMASVKKVALRIKEVSDKTFVGMKVEGVDVAHAHVHVFPFNNPEEFNNKPDRSKDPDNQSLKVMAEKLKFN